MEYGLNARVGRTLESTRCSTAVIDREALAEAADVLLLDIREETFLETDPATALSGDAVALSDKVA